MKTKPIKNNVISSAVRLKKVKENGTQFTVNVKHRQLTSKAFDLLSSVFYISVKLTLTVGHAAGGAVG